MKGFWVPGTFSPGPETYPAATVEAIVTIAPPRPWSTSARATRWQASAVPRTLTDSR